jgi:release factor glutamine methyltransferase
LKALFHVFFSGCCYSAKILKTLQFILTIREAYLKSREILLPFYGHDESVSVSKRLFDDVFSITYNTLAARPDMVFHDEEKLNGYLHRLLTSEPLQHITGFEYFHGLRLRVGPDVLIPRPETAELADWVLSEKKDVSRVADICTGSGCIALALRQGMPEARITATDISVAALEIARQNEQDNFSTASINFMRHNILTTPWQFEMPEVVVSNPPYIALSEASHMHRNVLDFEPHEALFVEGEDTLLFYRKIIDTFLPLYPVSIFFELNPLSAVELELYCREKKLGSEFRKDMQGKIRFAHIYL